MKSEMEKLAIRELDIRGAIHWGLATSLKFKPTIEYIVSLLRRLDEGYICSACDGKGCDYYDVEEREKCINGIVRKV